MSIVSVCEVSTNPQLRNTLLFGPFSDLPSSLATLTVHLYHLSHFVSNFCVGWRRNASEWWHGRLIREAHLADTLLDDQWASSLCNLVLLRVWENYLVGQNRQARPSTRWRQLSPGA